MDPPPGSDETHQRLVVTDIEGTGFGAGVTYGQAHADLIGKHLASVIDRASRRRGVSEAALFERARLFEPFVRDAVPDLADEIDGIAHGAGIERDAAWLLQLRAEVSRIDPDNLPSECTSFGVAASRTGTGSIAGQNADLPSFYQQVVVLIRRITPGKPRVLTLTPAGQVGWHGMNSAGVAVFANFLYSSGWRPGVPRYLFTRIALESDRARDAAARLIGLYRGSPRNLLFADDDGVFDLELAVDDAGFHEPVDGVVAHANHHVSSLVGREKAPASYLGNSTARHNRMQSLVSGTTGNFDVASAFAILRDRHGVPDALCRAPDDEDGDDNITVASTVADVTNRRLWIAIGPPHVGTYHEYEV
jgi:hypothetical protein